MKQGQAGSNSYEPKREPIPHKVSEGAVSQIGTQAQNSIDLYKGRGYEAPKANVTTHHCGSQGKHR